MKKILLTGGTGFIGRNALPVLRRFYDVSAPGRDELNLLDANEVFDYVHAGKFDVILHFANPNPVKNDRDKNEKMFEDSLRIFINLYNTRNLVDKLFYLGSGAEFGKQGEIAGIDESETDRCIPSDPYGLAKYIINKIAAGSQNVYNLRIFACFGPHDHTSKFITHAIRCCLGSEEITIRQDCYFDYMHVDDFIEILLFFIEHAPLYKDYNICTGKKYLLSEIAAKVAAQMNNKKNIKVLSPGLNKEYSASNKRLLRELADFEFTSIDDGIKKQVHWETENFYSHEKTCC